MSNFGDLTNIEEFSKKEHFIEERGNVSFFCKDCQKIVEINRPNPEGYIFICKNCNSKNISIGTLEGIKERYKIKN